MAKYIKTEDGYRTAQDIGLATAEIVQMAQETADSKMDAINPTGTGYFSMNRKVGSVIGTYSHAEGGETTASGYASHAEGYETTASGNYSHAEGYGPTASGYTSHVEGFRTTASGYASHAEGYETTASGHTSHAEGFRTTASGDYSRAEGNGTVAQRVGQHVQGMYNIADIVGNDEKARGKYAHIVGNGTTSAARSNAHTLDWNGVGWFQGGLQVGGNAQDDGAKNVLLEGDAIPVPENATAGDLLTYDGTNWIKISRADLIAEIIAALPRAEEASF